MNDRADETAPVPADPPPDCWKTVGVFGRGRGICEVLDRVIHCRNCPIFTRAGRTLLERDLPPGYREAAARDLAKKHAGPGGNEQTPGDRPDAPRPGTDRPDAESLVIFRIEREWLALPTRLLAEVVDPEKFHSLPHRKNPVLLGVVNVHGDIQLCVSLKALLDIEDAPDPRRDRRPTASARKGSAGIPSHRRMMVIGEPGAQWVFPVDEILGIERVSPGLFRRTPVTVAKAGSAYTRAIFAWRPDRGEGIGRESGAGPGQPRENAPASGNGIAPTPRRVNVALLDADLILYSLPRNVQ
jgi:chemotaxis-related protein WspD